MPLSCGKDVCPRRTPKDAHNDGGWRGCSIDGISHAPSERYFKRSTYFIAKEGKQNIRKQINAHLENVFSMP